jgi:hypothetical protein
MNISNYLGIKLKILSVLKRVSEGVLKKCGKQDYEI